MFFAAEDSGGGGETLTPLGRTDQHDFAPSSHIMQQYVARMVTTSQTHDPRPIATSLHLICNRELTSIFLGKRKTKCRPLRMPRTISSRADSSVAYILRAMTISGRWL